MPIPTSANRVRAAISRGDYGQADLYLAEYRREVESRWEDAGSDAERQALKIEVQSLLGWARTLTLTRKAHAQAKLVRLNSQRAYAGPPRQTNVWEMKG